MPRAGAAVLRPGQRALKGAAPDRLEHRVQVRALDLGKLEGAGVVDLARLVGFHDLAYLLCRALARRPVQCPHVCNDGWITIGQIVVDPETGEESVEYALYLCRKFAERS